MSLFCRSLFVILYFFFWPLCCLFFFDLQIRITPLVAFGHCVVCSSSIYRFWLPLWYLLAIVLSVLLRFTDSDYPFGSFWPLCCLFFFDLQILITPLVAFDHCVVWSSSIYGFWLPLWYLHTLFFFIGKYGKMLENLLLLNGLNSTTMIIRRTYTYLSILYWSNKTNTRPPPAIIVLHCTYITFGGGGNRICMHYLLTVPH
jgi:hypothetical protein